MLILFIFLSFLCLISCLGFGFLFWCLFMGAIITKQYSSSTDLETIQEEIILDESIEEMIPEVPNQ